MICLKGVGNVKFYIFGSCAGTSPKENRHHTSFAIESDERVYWFDAGETCSYTAHLMGVDLLSVPHVFISHPHMDHVGGLGNLLWNIRKVSRSRKTLPKYGDVTLHMPNEDTFNGMMTLLKATGKFSIRGVSVAGGVFHNLGQILVAMTLLENQYLLGYFPVLCVTGTLAGIVIGVVGSMLVEHIKRI